MSPRLPLVVEYLRTHSVADLMTDHGVRLSRATARPYKASLNYDQIAAKDSDPLAQECRGLVLATVDGSPIPLEGVVGDLVVLARPMDRFFNLGQRAAHEVTDDALQDPEARIWEKVDGTLCIVYFDTHADEWCVATRAVPDADRLIDGFGDHTFRSLFDEALRSQLRWSMADLAERLVAGMTYCFELTSPRAGSGVVKYESEGLHLLAYRDNERGHEFCPAAADDDLPIVASHPAMSVDAVRALIESRSPAVAEGVVLRLPGRTHTGGFRRVKVKSTAYVAAHGLSSDVGASPRNLLRVILKGMWDDVGPLCKAHLRERGDNLREAFNAWCAHVDAQFVGYRHPDWNRKAFAIAVTMAGLPIAPMMSLWQGQVADTNEWVQSRAKGGDWGDGFLDNLAGWLAT